MESHGWLRLAPFRWSPQESVLRRREALPVGVVELAISFDGHALHVRGARNSETLRSRLKRMFQLDVDTSEFVALTRASASHAWVEKEGFGRLLCGATLWEDAVKIIATTNTRWRQTVRMVELLVAKCGREGAFPDPGEVSRFSEAELQNDCRFVRETYHGDRRVSDATMLRRYSKWGRWKYLAYWSELWGCGDRWNEHLERRCVHRDERMGLLY